MGFRPPFKAALAASFALAGCAAQTSANNSAVCDAYRAGRSHVEVVADGRVIRVLGIQNGRVSPHEGFIMRLNSGCNVTVRVEVNTDLAGTFPVNDGDPVTVKGEYEYYSRGGVIHWTHHDPRYRHEAGFITIGNKTYQ